MILYVDVHYREDRAKAAGVLFKDWMSDSWSTVACTCQTPADYVSGEFYKRELPCITELLKKVDLNKVHTIVVDGYVKFNDKDGLGAKLEKELRKSGWTGRVGGIAKSHNASAAGCCTEVVRNNTKPLYVQNLNPEDIQNAYGKYRMPDVLKACDKLSKTK